MTKKYLNPPELFDSRQFGFSQGVATQGGTTIRLSGQVAWDEHMRPVGKGDLEAQTRQSLRNVATALKAAGGSLADVVSLRLYLVDYQPEEGGAVAKVLKESFSNESPPATTWVGVSALADPHFRIEIEAEAVLD